MLPKRARLRTMPITLDTRSRLVNQAFVTACDLIETAYTELRNQRTIIIRAKERELPNCAPVCCTCCWSIVDQLHMIRQLLQKEVCEPGSKALTLKNSIDAATQMRNKMDHLNSNVDNLAGMKKAMNPVHGVWSFLYDADGRGNFTFCLVPFSKFQHKKTEMVFQVDTHKTYTRSDEEMVFSAFGHKLDLTTIYSKVKGFIFERETTFRQAVKDHLGAFVVPGDDYFLVDFMLDDSGVHQEEEPH